MIPNKKRGAEREKDCQNNNPRYGKGEKTEEDLDENSELVFEDPFGDDFDEEDMIAEESNEIVEDESDVMDTIIEEDETKVNDVQPKVWRPGVDKIEEGETLDYDPSAYIMYHSLRTEWPCLSFDFIKDNLGDGRQRFPLTMFAVLGSQADRQENNKLTILKLSDLHKTQIKEESDEDDNDDEDDDVADDEDPTLEHIDVPHRGGVNRVRVMPQNGAVVASMADTGHVQVFDCTASVTSLMQKGPRAPAPTKPCFVFRGHRSEGFALDWSRCVTGRLATGDCDGGIHVWDMQSSGAGSGGWKVDEKPYVGHTSSVEDIQWSPSEATVFISASSDRSVKIWDTRDSRRRPQLSMSDVHASDVNVLSWNSHVSYLLASGADDGSFKVWDLRGAKASQSVALASFSYHKQAVTAIEWAPFDESVLCVSSADDQVTIWDLSVEAEEETPADGSAAYPPQLLFIHQGQRNVKELHFHPQIPGVVMTTAEDGLNVFKPAITVG